MAERGGVGGGPGDANGIAGATDGWTVVVGTCSLVVSRGVAVLPEKCGNSEERAGALSGCAFWRVCARLGVASRAISNTVVAAIVPINAETAIMGRTFIRHSEAGIPRLLGRARAPLVHTVSLSRA